MPAAFAEGPLDLLALTAAAAAVMFVSPKAVMVSAALVRLSAVVIINAAAVQLSAAMVFVAASNNGIAMVSALRLLSYRWIPAVNAAVMALNV
jgi:hypothetical protein